MIVERLIATAAAAGGRTIPANSNAAGSDRDRNQVVGGRPDEVLDHLAVAGSGQVDHAGDAARVARCEHDTGRFDRDVGAGADRDADVGSGECGCVVDAVADHRDLVAACLEGGDLGVLVLREDLGEHFVDVELVGDGVGDLAGVAGDHRHPDVTVVKILDGHV